MGLQGLEDTINFKEQQLGNGLSIIDAIYQKII